MRRNEFDKQIEIYSVSPVADGYGGYSTSATLVDRRWAKVEPLGAGSALTDYGLEDANRSVRIVIRKNNLFISADYFIMYRGATYKITSGPVEIDFKNRFIEFTCQELIDKSNVQQEPSESFYASGFYESGFYEGATT
jgi:SPP1 family predicted phage head-tail adaptor